ncbi:MAG: HAD-IIIA family hydrolase [Rickettsiales bacterium]|nr:HAD-IIIA family hydrolase [Rickettsiales bacterium]
MLVLLDRDGVINEDLPHGVTHIHQFRLLAGALEAMASLTRAGFRIAIVTNQSVIGKGLASDADVRAIHQMLCEQAEASGALIDRIYLCPDHPQQASFRRKPSPGMLLEALSDFNAVPERTPMVGDALRDLQAAHAAGCPRWLVKTGKGAQLLAQGLPAELMPVMVADDLRAAARDIIQMFRSA